VSDLNVVVATDCGSTTTKAILLQRTEEGWRQTHRGEAPTTVEAPFEDVTRGVLNAVQELEELSGLKLLQDGRIKTPREDGLGADAYISTSSAGGGLQVVVGGVVSSMSAASAQKAALGAGAIVMDTLAVNDGRAAYERIERVRELRPDMILLAGGVDGGTRKHVIGMAEQLRAARPRTRLGGAFNLPVIYAGNTACASEVTELLEDLSAFTAVQNVRPAMEREVLGPARDTIHELFMEHVMQQAPGYPRLMEWVDAPVMPTPGAVGLIMQSIATQRHINVVGVDIGGATTDVFSVFDEHFNRTVSANLGMSYSVSNVLAEAGLANVLRWVPFDVDESDLRNRIGNKMIRPTTIPQVPAELSIEQAIAREALRLAFEQHKTFATSLKGVQKARTIADAFRQVSADTLVDMMALDLLVGSGGVLSHAPARHQSMHMLIDAFAPEGVTELAVDSIFMMPHLGVFSTVDPEAATEVFERDCLIYLGTCVAAVGQLGAGRPAMRVRLTGLPEGHDPGDSEFTLHAGELKLVPASREQQVKAVIEPEGTVDVGAGPGKVLERRLRGGVTGLVFDARGRPLRLSDTAAERVAALERWHDEMARGERDAG
jgi:uncharacterized protein (TIGR01319 family)